MSDTSVRVAVRIRPQLAKEIIDLCQICTSVTPGEPQVVLGKDKAFTYDYVFDVDTGQPEIYTKCAHELIEGTFEGYNATIFAYGQTGSGKTYTMGTGFDVNVDPEQVGIIPRAVKHLFDGIERRRCEALSEGRLPPDFKVNAQFIELYNEELLDLLDTTRDPSVKGHYKSHIRIHEDANGSIYTVGITTKPVNSLSDTMQCLKTGALIRTTGSTNMNAQSSRSHAIFTLMIRQQRVVELAVSEEPEAKSASSTDFEVLTAKFHFVDLAGSERLKRTGATGHRAKEGISINCGLLALGNVISALGDQTKKASHIPYRDSKLTRLLQDSLGGNSRTVMITCISPSDRDFMETMNALKYANRARNIKNRVMVNQDKTSQQIAGLRMRVQALELELLEYKTGKRVDDTSVVQSDVSAENMLLQSENNNLRQRIKALQNAVDSLSARNAQLSAEIDSRNLSSFQDNVNEETKKLMETYRRIIEDQKARIDELEVSKSSVGPFGNLSSSSSSSQPYVSNSMLAATAAYVMDFNRAPEEHMQEVLKAARRDLKRLRSKACVKEGKTAVYNKASEDGDKDSSSAAAEKDGLDEDNDGNLSSDESTDSDESTARASDAAADDAENGNGGLLHGNLDKVSNQISIHEKLISELALSKRRAEAMRVHYEEKLQSLSKKISETESERDKVLAALGTTESQNQEVVSRVRETYEKKLGDMQSELRKLESAKLEHAKVMRNQALYENKCREYQQGLLELKKQKVQLEIKIREENQKTRQKELEYNKERNQLLREQKQKDSTIRTLEAEKRQREVVLRQKLEEVESLRRNQRPVSASRAEKLDRPQTARKTHKKSSDSRACAVTWAKLEKSLSSIISKKQKLALMEKDVEVYMKQRNSLSKKVDRCKRRREKLLAVADSSENDQLVKEIDDQLINLHDQISYTQDNINDIIANISQLDEAKSEDEIDPENLVGNCSLSEARYMLEKCIALVVSKGTFAAEKEAESKELDARARQERHQAQVMREMLDHLVPMWYGQNVDSNLPSSFCGRITSDGDSDSDGSEDSSELMSPVGSRSTCLTPSFDMSLPADEMLKANGARTKTPDGSRQFGVCEGRQLKARKKTATTEDLLFAGSTSSSISNVESVVALPESTCLSNVLPPQKIAAQSHTATVAVRPDTLPCKLEPGELPVNRKGLQHVTSLEVTAKMSDLMTSPITTSPAVSRSREMLTSSNVLSMSTSSGDSTCSLGRSEYVGSESVLSLDRPIRPVSPSQTRLPVSPHTVQPVTPQSTSKSQQHLTNVFSRLTSNIRAVSEQPGRGVITPATTKGIYNPSSAAAPSSPLVLCATATGHSKAVLSLFADSSYNLLFSGSKDRTCKMWDLSTNEELLTLDDHPNSVTAVKFCADTSLVYTVSGYVVKVWDPRHGNTCIKTLLSAGIATDGPSPGNNNGPASRTMTLPQGETTISDIAVTSNGKLLYSASGNIVRIWDIREFKSIGKLSGGHQAAIMTLAVDDTDTADGNICLVTGSKDHYIKVFDLMEDSCGVIGAKYTLDPPHYDGIQSLCLMGDLLFSGSRDMCLKKWDLAEQQMKQSVNGAHKDWICGLAFMPGSNCLASACRGGILKVWNVDSCAGIGEIQAHNSAINAITANEQLLFSASDDRTICCWKSRFADVDCEDTT